MREIKFRGKDIKTGEWAYGDLHTLCDHPHIHTEPTPYPYAGRRSFVDTDTIGQFTGLTDINGREIYEGDIVEYYSTDTYCINPDCEPQVRGYGLRLCKRIKTVMFDEGVFYADNTFVTVPLAHEGIQVEDIDELKNDPYFDANGYDLDDVIGFEVIGNIHDNPDLIEKGGEQ